MVPSSPKSPPRNFPSPVHVKKPSFGVSQQTGKDASSSASPSQVTIVPNTDIQKTSPARPTEKSMAQVTMMSRPSSAPLVPGGPRPTTTVVSMVQTTPLARSASATGRLGPDPSPATHSHVPQSYRNAMMGNHITSTAASFTHSSSSSGVNPSSSYSQPPLVSSSMFLPQSSDKMDSMAGQSNAPFGMMTRDVLQNGPHWIESPQREASRSMHYEPPSRLSDVQNFDLYKPVVDSRSLDHMSSEFQACTSRRQNQGLLVDEFPHLDIINDLLDEEHGVGMAAGTSSVFHSHNDGSQLLNRQFSYPGDLGTSDDLGSSSSSCRFERSRSYDPGYQQGYNSSGGHFDSRREYHPRAGALPYGNGKVDGLVPNQWQVAGSDLSYLGIRNLDSDGYSYYQDYSNLTCGSNGYTFRPSNGQ